jgi:hypothetical protein
MNFKLLKVRAWGFLIAALVFLAAATSFATVTYTVGSLVGPYTIGGQSKQAVSVLDLYGTYVADGFALTPRSFGLSTLQSVQLQVSDGYGSYFNPTTSKVLLYDTATGAQLGSVDVGAVNVNTVVTGW